MFGISLSEFVIIVLVACIVMRPKDVPHVIKFLKIAYQKFSKLKKEISSYYSEFHDEILDEDDEDKKYIIDDQGLPQRAYDISELKELSSKKKIQTTEEKGKVTETV